MRTLIQASVFALAFLGSASFAVAQTAPGGVEQQEKLNLSQSKEGQITRGLNREQSQSAADYGGPMVPYPGDPLETELVA